MEVGGDEIEWVAPDPELLLDDAERRVRSGQVSEAAFLLAGSELGPAQRGPMVDALRADGFGRECDLIDLAVRRPEVFEHLDGARRAGWVLGAVVFVLTVWPAGMLALLPAMAARLLGSELYVRAVWRRSLDHLYDDEKRSTRLLIDLDLYRTSSVVRFGLSDASALLVGGVVVYGVALWARSSGADGWLPIAFTVGGTAMSSAGLFAVGAALRIRRAGLQDPESGAEIGARMRSRARLHRFEEPHVIRSPRRGRSYLPALVLGSVGVMMVLTGILVSVVLGAVLLAIALWCVARAQRAQLLIGPDGVTDVGVLRTRHWDWDGIRRVRLVVNRDAHRSRVMRMETSSGADVMLATSAGREGWDHDEVRFCESMNLHVAAPVEGPTRRAVRWRVAGALGLWLVVVLFLVLAWVAAYSDGWIDGGSNPDLVCPSLLDRISATQDPICDPSFRRAAIATAVSGSLAVGMAVPALRTSRSARLMAEAHRNGRPRPAQ